MTLGELAARLGALISLGTPPDLEITVRGECDGCENCEGNMYYIGGISAISLETAHDDDATPFIALDCNHEEDE